MSAPRKLLLLCSPGFGLIDAWLPVIKKLREREDVIIDFIFPEPSSLRLEEKNSDLFNLAETFVDNIIFRGYSGRWFTASSLIEARNGIKYGSLDKKILRFSSRLKKGALSKYLVMRVIGEYLLIVAKYIAHVKENLGKQDLYDIGLLRGANGLLYDVLLEEKSENNELMDKLKYIAKFSIAHGTDLRWISIDIPNNRKEVKDRSDVVVYAISNFEKKWYKEYFGILYGNMVHAGIPKHDNDWIKFVCSQHYSAEKYAFDSFVFIIGRPASPYNTPNRKKKALEDIYDIVCNKNKLKLVVKTHPKESLDNIDGKIYMDALGAENYGKKWIYSDRHPFILGKKSFFSISFYSSLSIDMLALDKPTIEYLDLNGLESYDNNDSLRDNSNGPVFQYRYKKLVLGASNNKEFEEHVNLILNNYKEALLPLSSSYLKIFEPFDGASEMVANDIINRLNKNKGIG